MVVYIEYAFLWNFLLDGTLLALAFFAGKEKPKGWRLVCSCVLGGAFAVVFPLLTLPKSLAYLLKISVGCLLCGIPFTGWRKRRAFARYVWICALFFAFTFAFGGALTALQVGKRWAILLALLPLIGGAVLMIRKFYQKRSVEKSVYDCVVGVGETQTKVRGFYDSGNLAEEKGVPICFLSPDAFYDVVTKQDCAWERGEEITFHTLGGSKKARAYLGFVAVQIGGEYIRKTVYFCPSAHMIGRAYKLLLNAKVLDET